MINKNDQDNGKRLIQQTLFDSSSLYEKKRHANAISFRASKHLPVHRWYPYVEGFSAQYVKNWLQSLESEPKLIYDPFGGSGTTMFVSSIFNISSIYAEVNPLMRFVSEAKTTCAAWARNNFQEFLAISDVFRRRLVSSDFDKQSSEISLDSYFAAFPRRDYFVLNDLKHLLLAKQYANEVAEHNPFARDLLLLVIASQTVPSSNMTRRADLRRRRSDEYKSRVVDVRKFLLTQLDQILQDIRGLPLPMAPVKHIGNDARLHTDVFDRTVDFIITSPPYLNGTNYFRNTKLELWILDLIDQEGDLKAFRDQAIAAGINNISSTRQEFRRFAKVENIVDECESVAKDKRIPMLIRAYFSDMSIVIENCLKVLEKGGSMVIDIGDSKYYGVHIPTDMLLADISQNLGFELDKLTCIASRQSRDKTPLKQTEIVLRKI